jgi:deoxyribodipyrimidine photo-lyase
MKDYSTSLCWFRRDLRLYDHAALYDALRRSEAVHCIFVFDTDILDALIDRKDRRVEFIWRSVQELHQTLRQRGSALHILHGRACLLIPQFVQKLGAQAVFLNRDYEPAAIERDADITRKLAQQGVVLHAYKDQVIFEQNEILTGAGKPFSVFTPYRNAWLRKLEDSYLYAYPVEKYFSALARSDFLNKHIYSPPSLKAISNTLQGVPDLSMLGFQKTNLNELALPCGMSGAEKLFDSFKQRIEHYREWRDFPAIQGGSYLSTHLRFGTISIRSLVRHAYYAGGNGAQVWLSELIWREFYKMLLYYHPYVIGHAFKPQFRYLAFSNDKDRFSAWRNGLTGYPFVDAGMRQLNQTGFMHNRLRMITASFLVKDLQIDWRWGEKYFAEKLIDFDLSSNNGGWQWAASTGCDAQPWFRIFNPVTQSERFDPKGEFIRRYVPELANCPDKFIHAPWLLSLSEQHSRNLTIGKDYPARVVDHVSAREKALLFYESAKLSK